MAIRNRMSLIPIALCCIVPAFAGPGESDVAAWTVKVQAADGAALGGATVTLFGIRDEQALVTERTDAAGKAVVQPPALGSYRIRVEIEGFQTQEQGYIASPRGSEVPPIVFRMVRRR